MTPAGTNLLLAHADSTPAPADVVTKSVRFNRGDSPKLTRTFGTPTSRRKVTISFWMKLSEQGDGSTGYCGLFSAGTSGAAYSAVQLTGGASNMIKGDDVSGGYQSYKQLARSLRDLGAWMHVCYVVDTTDSTADDRAKFYINGVRDETFDSTYELNYSLNDDTYWSASGTELGIGLDNAGGGSYFGGYLADIHYIDGQALDPTYFAEEDTTTGQWKPKEYSGTGYGNQGFHLDFKDSSDIGKDVSGENNDFSVTNLAASDVMLDTPTNNYCTFNALNAYSPIVDMLAEGNLRVTTATGASGYQMMSTMGVSSGKWYYEYRDDSPSTRNTGVGWVDSNEIPTGTGSGAISGNGAIFYHDYIYVNGGGASAGAQLDNGDIAGVALDADAGKIWFSLNGTWWDSQDPAAGSNAKYTASTNSDIWVPSFMDGNYGQGTVNYGQDGTFAGAVTAQGNADGNGKGDFYYTPPTGFLALCTGNLPTPTIAKGVTYFDVLTYDDGAGAKTFDNGTVSMQPDLVWVKSRGSAYDHKLTDSVRGVTKALESNTTDVEATESTGLTAFGSDGFTVGADTNYSDTTGDGMVAWNWKKSATAGFNIVGWTGDDDGFSGGTQAVAHGLGVAPEMVIAKNRTDEAAGNGNWIVYHKDTTSGDLLKLNSTDGEFTPDMTLIGSIGSTNVSFGNDSPNSEYLNSDNSFGSGTPDTYIGYFFASVAGFSKVGSFSGSSTALIYTDFRPSFILAKRSDATGGNWLMFDDKREGYNVDNDDLMANSSAVEATTDHIDILSNGFKVRTSDADLNGGTLIYLAVAKNPFKYASAR